MTWGLQMWIRALKRENKACDPADATPTPPPAIAEEVQRMWKIQKTQDAALG